jgi:hypothetical protein
MKYDLKEAWQGWRNNQTSAKILILSALLWVDRWCQDHWFGGHWETISGHLGKTQLEFGGKIPWNKRPLQAAVSRFLDWLDPNHCRDSIGY